MSMDILTEVSHEQVQVNLDNDELIVIETLQYGSENPEIIGGGSSSNCNCNSCCNGSSEDPIG